MENNQFNNTNPDFNIPTDEATNNPIKKVKRWARKNPKKFNIVMASITGAAVVTAILAPTLVAVTRKGGGVTPTPTPSSTYEVTFNANGGTISGQDTKVIKVASESLLVDPSAETVKSGYALSGWMANGKAWDFANDKVTAATTLTAQWVESPTPTEYVYVTYKAGANGKFADGTSEMVLPVAKGAAFKSITKPEVKADDDWSHTGWLDSSEQEINPDTPITANTTFKAKYSANPKKNTITFLSLAGETTSPWTVTVKGITTYNLLAKDYKTYGSFELPVAECAAVDGEVPTFAHWSKERQTEKTVLPTAIKSTDTITDGDKLYPCFSFDAPTKQITLNVRLINDSHHSQSLTSGSLTIKVPYKNGSSDNKKFGELNMPNVYEYNKVCSKYYQNYDTDTGAFSNEWIKTTPIDDNVDGKEIYVLMEDPITDPIIKFAIDPAWATAGHSITWVGNQEVWIKTGDKLSSIATPNAYCDATAHPNPSIGFITDWYFTGWYKSDDTSKTILDSSTKFDTSCTLYPKFEQKTNVVIQTYKVGTTATDPLEARYLPTDTWGDVKKPSSINGMGSSDIFVDWQADLESGETSATLLDLFKVGQIKSTDHKTVTIKPNIQNEGNCHEFNFISDAHVKGTASTTTPVTLAGNMKVGILKSDTDPIDINLKLNKPILPKTDDSTTPATIINDDVTFENEWEISKDQTQWDPLETYDPIPAASSRTVYYVRPVVIKNATINFDANGGSFKPWGPESKPAVTQIKVSPEEIFANMYKPEVVPPDTTKAFKCWVDSNNNEVQLTQQFSVDGSPYTLKAKYADNWVTSTVNFKIDDEALNDPYFPAEPFNDDNCEPTIVKHIPDDEIKFGQFAQHVPTRPCHKLIGWYYLKDGNKVTCDENTVIPSSTRTLDVYAIWEKTGNYHEVTIKSDPTNYTNDGDATLYVKEGATFINNETKQLYSKSDDGKKIVSESKIWKVGQKIKEWKDADGNTVSPIMGDKNLQNIYPVFENADPIYVKFKTSASQEWSLSSTADKPIPIYDKLSTYIAKSDWAPIATKAKGTFDRWAIYNGDDVDPTPITDDYRVTGQITLVPQFIDESIFEGSSDPYYYDENAKMWASIKTFYEEGIHIDELGVHYQDGTDGWVDKASFDAEIKFGSQMTKLPDYFMFGCSSWTNGGKPLYLPTGVASGGKISGLTSIGHDVMNGCISFNQPITILASTNATGVIFKIGQNFMRGCSTFNKDISIKWNVEGEEAGKAAAILAIADGFMFECNNFAGTLDLTGWKEFDYLSWTGEVVTQDLSEEHFYSCLSTTDQDYKQFKVLVNSDLVNEFKNLFPTMDGTPDPSHPYRWAYRNIDVEGK